MRGDHGLRRDVAQVAVGHGERGVSERVADHVHRDAFAGELGGVRVPQAVGVDTLSLDPSSVGEPGQQPPDVGGVEAAAAQGAQLAAAVDPPRQQRGGLLIEAHGARAIALAVADPQGAERQVDVAQLQGERFARPAARSATGPRSERDSGSRSARWRSTRGSAPGLPAQSGSPLAGAETARSRFCALT